MGGQIRCVRIDPVSCLRRRAGGRIQRQEARGRHDTYLSTRQQNRVLLRSLQQVSLLLHFPFQTGMTTSRLTPNQRFKCNQHLCQWFMSCETPSCRTVSKPIMQTVLGPRNTSSSGSVSGSSRRNQYHRPRSVAVEPFRKQNHTPLDRAPSISTFKGHMSFTTVSEQNLVETHRPTVSRNRIQQGFGFFEWA
jgi:hypothetical protein